jgi:NADP-dependent 3-hydroxy acid dehydrogenase YdfG
MRPLTADDVAEVVSYVVNLPEHIDVLDLVLMPTAQRSTQVVHRGE